MRKKKEILIKRATIPEVVSKGGLKWKGKSLKSEPARIEKVGGEFRDLSSKQRKIKT